MGSERDRWGQRGTDRVREARWRGRAEGALPLPPQDAVLPLLKIHTLRHRVPQARVRLEGQEQKQDTGKAAPRTPPGESEPGKVVGTEQALEQPLLTLRPLSRADKTPLQTAAPILSAARRGSGEWPFELLLKCGGCSASLEGVPDLPGAPQDEASLTRKFEWRR